MPGVASSVEAAPSVSNFNRNLFEVIPDQILDFMAYTRGADDEYNRWAKLTGDPGWAWKNMEQFYLKVSARQLRIVAAELTLSW